MSVIYTHEFDCSLEEAPAALVKRLGRNEAGHLVPLWGDHLSGALVWEIDAEFDHGTNQPPSTFVAWLADQYDNVLTVGGLDWDAPDDQEIQTNWWTRSLAVNADLFEAIMGHNQYLDALELAAQEWADNEEERPCG